MNPRGLLFAPAKARSFISYLKGRVPTVCTICPAYKGPVNGKYKAKYQIQNQDKIQYAPLRKALSTTKQLTKYNTKTECNMPQI